MRNGFLLKEQGASQNASVFFENGLPHFYTVFCHLRHGERTTGDPKMGPGPLRIRGHHFLVSRCVCLCPGCCQSFLVLSVSVWSVVVCQMRVGDVLCAVSLGGTMRSAVCELLAKTASVIFLLPKPWAAIFSMANQFLCGKDHFARTTLANEWDLRQMLLWCTDLVGVLCVVVRRCLMLRKPVVLSHFLTVESIFHRKGLQIEDVNDRLGLPSPYDDS